MAFLVGLTGGIGAGKSTVAAVWRALGADIVDADQLAREVVAPGTEALSEIASRFGADVLLPNGALDRSALAQIIFADPAQRSALEHIIHPAVQRLARSRLTNSTAEIAVYDVPLLVEAARAIPFDRVVVVSAPAEQRLRRLIEIRGMDEASARRRIRSQATEAERLALADLVIDASGTLADTQRRASAAWETLRAAAAATPRSA